MKKLVMTEVAKATHQQSLLLALLRYVAAIMLMLLKNTFCMN